MNAHEALEWLTSNKNPSAFASNRFGETEKAIEFVKMLYYAGAVNISVVGILDELERVEAEGGPYADTLIVELPSDMQMKEKILEIYNNEIEECGLNAGELFSGLNESSLAFWWD